MTHLGYVATCSGCGESTTIDDFTPFRCKHWNDQLDTDHVLRFQLDLADSRFPHAGDPNPFIRYRSMLPQYRFARHHGVSDDEYISLVRTIDDRIFEIDGVRFVETPYRFSQELGVWYKDETNQVSGSHKSRHLMGLGLHLEIIDRLAGDKLRDTPLAIASCGNAALAAAIVAKACRRSLKVFVPPWADGRILDQLDRLGAERIVCERSPALPPGDPCVHGYRQEVNRGAVPFTCQGNENALAISGGMTLTWEMISQHQREKRPPLSRLIIHVGGGALASSVVQAATIATTMTVIERAPRIDVVQADNAHPLATAWRRLQNRANQGSAIEALAHARSHRSEYMSPWPHEPKSIATGILDDETYDWFAICEGLFATRGDAITVSEGLLDDAWRAAKHANVQSCATGSAGLAGFLAIRDTMSDDETTAIIFTGGLR